MTNILNKWKTGLARTSKATFGQLATLLGATEISEDTWDELEALLIHADIGVETTMNIMEKLENRVDREGITKTSDLNAILVEELRSHLNSSPTIDLNNKPTVIILIVGVNGSGKTTTIAKLGKRFSNQGMQIILGAADTFRAAAVDQLTDLGRAVKYSNYQWTARW